MWNFGFLCMYHSGSIPMGQCCRKSYIKADRWLKLNQFVTSSLIGVIIIRSALLAKWFFVR